MSSLLIPDYASTVITYTYRAKRNAHTYRDLIEFLAQQGLRYNGALQERIDYYHADMKTFPLPQGGMSSGN
ncbi:MAG: hypothetical protein OXG05_08265 [Gammaproteobacteria bacterium]|nr:hypothetical protein [Gammaproteobacteria bacterium]